MIVDIISIEQIKSINYGECLLVKTHPIIDSPFGWGGCVDASRIIALLYPSNEKMYSYLTNAKLNAEEYFEFAENGAFSYENVPGIGMCYIHNSFGQTNTVSSNSGCPLDLGLSVLWADINVGAADQSQYGTLFGYGDITGEKWSENDADYPSIDITGTEFDIAKAAWGKDWRMPTADELKELLEKCKWTPATVAGIRGNRVTGPNGNSIFMPYGGSRIGVSTYREGQMGGCWAGTLSKSGSPVNMMYFGCNATLNWGAAASWGANVRPVKNK
jgi:hypothetical protein